MIYQREFNLSPVEFVKFQLYNSINLPNPILNESDVTVLAYIHVYGSEAKKKIIEHRIFTNANSFNNYVIRLRSMGYIKEKGEKKEVKLNPEIIILDKNFVQLTKVNLDTNSAKVVHPFFNNKEK